MNAELEMAYPPAWAADFGEDRFGLYAAFRVKDCEFRWRWIPPGRFRMGSPDDEANRMEREGPRHWVRISRGFWLGETPVTQAQWTALNEENPSGFAKAADAPQRPVENVSWTDATKYCEQLNRLLPTAAIGLPTEAQWEYACRAGTETGFYSGPADDPLAAMKDAGWCFENSEKDGEHGTHPVRDKAPNDFGLFDMHGNVWEWCRDGMREYGSDAVTDPMGPTGGLRAVRGGGWDDVAGFCRSAFRSARDPGDRDGCLGFRLAAGLELEASREAERAEPQMKGAEQP